MLHAGERFDDGWGMIEGGVACYLQVRDVGGVGGVFFTLVELWGKTRHRTAPLLLPYAHHEPQSTYQLAVPSGSSFQQRLHSMSMTLVYAS